MVTRTFIHIHLPKCGGSTFWKFILKKNFKENFHRDSSLIQNYQYKADQIQDLLRVHNWINCFSSHKISLDLPYNWPGKSIIPITFIRNPVDRFISHYFFHRNHELDYVPQAKMLRLDDYISFALDNQGQEMYINGQTRLLTGNGDDQGIDQVIDAIETKQLLVFPLKKFDDACLLLERLYPDQLKDCSYPKIANVSHYDQQITEEMRGWIRQYNAKDDQLQQVVDTKFHNILSDYFPEQKELIKLKEDFAKRCRRENAKHKIKIWLTRLYRGIKN